MHYGWMLLAAVVFFFIGAAWYMAFAGPWMKAVGKTKSQLNPRDPVPYLISAGSALLNAMILDLALSFVQPNSLMLAVSVSVCLSLGIAGTVMAKHYAYSGLNRVHFLIDVGYDFVGFAAMAVVLYFGVYRVSM